MSTIKYLDSTGLEKLIRLVKNNFANVSHIHNDYANKNAFGKISVSTEGVSGTVNIDADTTTDTLNLVAGDNVSIVADASGDKITISGPDLSSYATTGQLSHTHSDYVNKNAFSNIAIDGQSIVSADTTTDTLNLVAGTNITLTTDAANDKITINGPSLDGYANQNAFSNIAVNGQSVVSADTTTDTLNLVAGDNVSITTDAANDKITISLSDNVATKSNIFDNFTVVDKDTGSHTSITSDQVNDELKFIEGDHIQLIGNTDEDSITISVNSEIISKENIDNIFYAVLGNNIIDNSGLDNDNPPEEPEEPENTVVYTKSIYFTGGTYGEINVLERYPNNVNIKYIYINNVAHTWEPTEKIVFTGGGFREIMNLDSAQIILFKGSGNDKITIKAFNSNAIKFKFNITSTMGAKLDIDDITINANSSDKTVVKLWNDIYDAAIINEGDVHVLYEIPASGQPPVSFNSGEVEVSAIYYWDQNREQLGSLMWDSKSGLTGYGLNKIIFNEYDEVTNATELYVVKDSLSNGCSYNIKVYGERRVNKSRAYAIEFKIKDDVYQTNYKDYWDQTYIYKLIPDHKSVYISQNTAIFPVV